MVESACELIEDKCYKKIMVEDKRGWVSEDVIVHVRRRTNGRQENEWV